MKPIKINAKEITEENMLRAQQVLIDNGIEEDEVDSVLQAIGYTLIDTELYPYPECLTYQR